MTAKSLPCSRHSSRPAPHFSSSSSSPAPTSEPHRLRRTLLHRPHPLSQVPHPRCPPPRRQDPRVTHPRVSRCTASLRHSPSKAPAPAKKKKATYQGPVESTSPRELPIRCPSPLFPATTSSPPRGCSAHPALCTRIPAGERSGEAGTRAARAVR